MINSQGVATLHRLEMIDWVDSWDHAFTHAQSRRLLMHEYLRRSALWAKHFSAENVWPFFDIAELIDSPFCPSVDKVDGLEDFLKTVPLSARSTCSGAVRLAATGPLDFGGEVPLPDLYAPLVLFYERGGEFLQDGAGFIDITGISIKLKSLAHHLESTPFLSFRATTLDAMDAEGAISYYKVTAGSSSGVVRRRILDSASSFDEIIRSEGIWEQTDQLKLAEMGAPGATRTQIGDIEAARMIERIGQVSP